MGTTSQQIEAHIEQTRAALGSNLDELEQKVRAATDWRHHFRTKPKILLGIAFGGGVVLSALFGGRNNRRQKRLLSKSSAGPDPGAESARREEVGVRQTRDIIRGAIIAVATTRFLNYASGVHRKSELIEKTNGVISPEAE